MGEKWAGLINVYRLHKWPIYRQSWSHLKLCLFAEIEPGCQQRLPFVCERHNVTSVEINPQEAQPGGLPCGNSSLSFRNKVCLRVYSTRCTTVKRIRVLPTHDVHTPVSKCNQSWRHSLCVYLPPTHSPTHSHSNICSLLFNKAVCLQCVQEDTRGRIQTSVNNDGTDVLLLFFPVLHSVEERQAIIIQICQREMSVSQRKPGHHLRSGGARWGLHGLTLHSWDC